MKKNTIEWKWALIFLLTTLLWMGLEKWMGWHDENIAKHAIYTNLFGILAIIIYFCALIDKRQNFYNGYMTWKQGFVTGLLISVIVAVFTPVTQLIVHKIISPSYFENAIQYAVDNNRLSLESAKSYFSLKTYIMQSIVGALGMGIITSALVALIVQRKIKS
ncbi:DUF4199 domain-containing protein [Membranihabitans marinus]|uniref:DUF4199 domain-containing protein n=1 Tax=Membranihabitans marinus TaxID=1227546 RepID=UPI001F1F71D2|nr:DUF4199 domain-containing protein [Membranihabitans marinus]